MSEINSEKCKECKSEKCSGKWWNENGAKIIQCLKKEVKKETKQNKLL